MDDPGTYHFGMEKTASFRNHDSAGATTVKAPRGRAEGLPTASDIGRTPRTTGSLTFCVVMI